MIDRICEDLERKAMDHGHDIGDGFEERSLFGMVPTLQMSCSKPGCKYLVVMDPETGRHIECNGGKCPGAIDCPICRCSLPRTMTCPRCGREWELTGDYEFPLMSKPRKIKLTRPITVGANLDDCIRVED